MRKRTHRTPEDRLLRVAGSPMPRTPKEVRRDVRALDRSLRILQRRFPKLSREEMLQMQRLRLRLRDLRWQSRIKDVEIAEREYRAAKVAFRKAQKAPRRVVDVEKHAIRLLGKWHSDVLTEENDLLIVKALAETPGQGVSWAEMQERCPGLKGMLSKASYRISKINDAVRKVLHHDLIHHQKGKKPWIEEGDL